MSKTNNLNELTKADISGRYTFIALDTPDVEQTAWMLPPTGAPIDYLGGTPLARTLLVKTPDGKIEPLKNKLLELGASGCDLVQ